MRPRSLALKQSPISEAIAGDPIAITMPSARRAANSVSYEVAAPHQIIASDHSAMPTTSRLRRLKRSTRMPNGSVSRALDATVTATSSPISRLLMRSAGSSWAATAPSVALSAESSARMHASMRMIRSRARPPARSSSGPSTLRDNHACNDVRSIAFVPLRLQCASWTPREPIRGQRGVPARRMRVLQHPAIAITGYFGLLSVKDEKPAPMSQPWPLPLRASDTGPLVIAAACTDPTAPACADAWAYQPSTWLMSVTSLKVPLPSSILYLPTVNPPPLAEMATSIVWPLSQVTTPVPEAVS